MSVVTVTPAGAIDLTYRIDVLRRGEVIRARTAVREVSGKGVNVAVALKTAGLDVAAVVALGADDESFVAASPHADLLRPVFLPGPTRVSTQIVDAEGRTTKVNAPAPPMTAAQWQDLVDATATAVAATGADWLVIGGALPPVDGGSAELGALLTTAHGARVVVDTSGEPLRRLLLDPAGVALLKPNVHELSEALGGVPLRTLGDVLAAGRVVLARGLDQLYVSMGPDGALVIARDRVVHALAPAARLASTAGAGDASLAGFVLGAGCGPELDLAAGCALAAGFGALAVGQEATLITSLDGLPVAVVTRDPDPDRLLTEPAAVGP
jgi:1-phosphofructokinase